MSKSISFETNEGYESREMSGEKGAEDEGNENENENEEGILEVPRAESSLISTTVSTAPATTDQLMHTPDFWRHFVGFVHVEML